MPRATCPVCTLQLREGMTLSEHLHTHPKALVIEALARLADGEETPPLAIGSRCPPLQPAPPPLAIDAACPPLQSAPPPPPPQLTSILYHQQFLTSTTTSFVDPSCLPPPPQLIMMAPVHRMPQQTPVVATINQQVSTTTQTQQTAGVLNEEGGEDVDQEDLEGEVVQQEDDEEEGNAQSTTTTAFQYPQLDNLNFQRHTQLNDVENNENDDVMICESGANREVEEEEEQVMNIGTVITDSQKIICNNDPLYMEHSTPNSPYVERIPAASGCNKSPVYRSSKASVSPVYVQTNVPGTTVFVHNSAPISPIYVQTSLPVSTVCAQNKTPGSPIYVQSKAPGGNTMYQRGMAPVSPIYAQDKAPGRSPIHTADKAPGRSPIYTEKASGRSPIYTAEKAPGRSPIYSAEKAPGSPGGVAPVSPIYTADNAPVSPIYQEELAPGSAVAEVSQQAHSPASSGYSVFVRRDLGTPGRSPSRDEYIVPGFEFDGDDSDDDNSEIVDDVSGLSAPALNIHTDESMPPRGELSGHGTNSSSMWQSREMDAQQPRKQQASSSATASVGGSSSEESWRRVRDTAAVAERLSVSDSAATLGRAGGKSPPTVTDADATAATAATPGNQLIQFRDATGEPFSSVCFIQPKKEQVKEEASSTIKLDDIKQDVKVVKKEAKRRIRTCVTCDQVFPTADEFNHHIKRVHPFECKVCGRCFMRSSGLTLHQKRHLKIKPYRCNYCEKSFVTNQKLTEHHNTHTGHSPFKCNLCEATFKRYSNLIQHKNRFHLKIKRKPKDYFCECGEVFHSPLKLAWHKESHDPCPKKCTYCSSRFVHEASLTRHIRKAHDPLYIPVVKKFKVLEPTRENVECPICHKVCLKGSLRNHMVVHSGVKPYACSSCGKRFFSKWNMKLHMWVHGSRSSMPFKCDVKSCKASFVRDSDLQDHLRSHKNLRQYSCNYCGSQFLRKFNWVRHTREHEQEKKHECKVCGKKFHRGYYLTEHMRVHTGMKPFTCHICSKQTATKTNHNKHLKTHHARQIIASEN